MNFTTKILNSFLNKELGKDRVSYVDTSGLVVQIRSRANKKNVITFQFRSQAGGKNTYRKIGEYPVLSLDMARAKWYEWDLAVKRGQTPWEKPKPQKKVVAHSFKAMWDEWRTIADAGLASSSVKVIHYQLRYFPPEFLSKDVEDITFDDCYALVQSLKPVAAKKLVIYAKQVFEFAIDRDLITKNPMRNINKYIPSVVTTHHVTFTEASMESDMREFFRALSQRDKEDQALMHMYFYTLLRNLEVREIELDKIYAEYFTVKTKTLDAFNVPLTKQMKRLIAWLNSQPNRSTKYLFQNSAHGKITDRRARDVIAFCGFKDRLSVHGIRSLGRMWLERLPYAKESTIELCLSHVVGNAVQQAYNRGEQLEERAKLMQAWNDFVEKCIGKTFY